MTCGKHPGDVRCCSRWRRQPLSVQRSWTRGRDLSRISTSTNLLCGNVCSVFVLKQTNYCERTRQTTADDGRRTPEDSTLVVFPRRPLSLSLSLSLYLLLLLVRWSPPCVQGCCCCLLLWPWWWWWWSLLGHDPAAAAPPCRAAQRQQNARKAVDFLPLAVVTKRGTNLLWVFFFVFFVISYFLSARHHLRS